MSIIIHRVNAVSKPNLNSSGVWQTFMNYQGQNKNTFWNVQLLTILQMHD